MGEYGAAREMGRRVLRLEEAALGARPVRVAELSSLLAEICFDVRSPADPIVLSMCQIFF